MLVVLTIRAQYCPWEKKKTVKEQYETKCFNYGKPEYLKT